MVKPGQVVAGALALEYSDVLLLVGGIAVVGVTLYLIEQHLQGELSDGINSLTQPFTNLAQSLSGPADGQTWSDYFFGTS